MIFNLSDILLIFIPRLIYIIYIYDNPDKLIKYLKKVTKEYVSTDNQKDYYLKKGNDLIN